MGRHSSTRGVGRRQGYNCNLGTQKENITPKAKIRGRVRGRVMERRVNLMKFPMSMTLVTGGGMKTTVGGLAQSGMFRKCMTRGFLMVVGILVKTGMVHGKKHLK